MKGPVVRITPQVTWDERPGDAGRQAEDVLEPG